MTFPNALKCCLTLLCGMMFPVVAQAAAQLKAGAATSAKPTAPAGSSLRQLQIQFDPSSSASAATTQPVVDTTRAVQSFQLTVGYNSASLTLHPMFDSKGNPIPDYSGTTFSPLDLEGRGTLIGPYSPFAGTQGLLPAESLSITSAQSPGIFDTYVTVRGQTSALVPGDVNIFSLLWDLPANGDPFAPVTVGIFGTDHSFDGSGLTISDFINSVDLSGVNPFSNDPNAIETTVITVVPATMSFTTVEGNSGLAVLPLPRAVTSGFVLLGFIAAAAAFSRSRSAAASA